MQSIDRHSVQQLIFLNKSHFEIFVNNINSQSKLSFFRYPIQPYQSK